MLQKAIRNYTARKSLEAFNATVGQSSDSGNAPSPSKQQKLYGKQQIIVQGLRKPTQLRNNIDVNKLVLATAGLKFFKNLPKDTHRELVRA